VASFEKKFEDFNSKDFDSDELILGGLHEKHAVAT
jgi:hypothetical protein